MKSLIFNLLFLFLSANYLIGQLATERNYCEINGFNGYNTVIRNTYLKDSMVSGKICSVFEINKAVNFLYTWWEYYTTKNYIAEEGDSIFVLDNDKWILDQDYSRKAGDTMSIDYYLNTYLDSSVFESFYIIIDSVYQKEYFGTFRTIQEVHSFIKLNNQTEGFSKKIINIKGIGSFIGFENGAFEKSTFVPDRMAFSLPCEFVPAHCGQFFNLCNVSWADEVFELSNLCDSLLSTSVSETEPTYSQVLKYTLVDSEIYLNPDAISKGKYAVYDVNGRMICSGIISSSRIDLTQVLPGWYVLQVIDELGFPKAEKLYKLP